MLGKYKPYNSSKNYRILIAGLWVLLSPMLSWAEDENQRSPMEERLIQGNISISEWFDSAAEGLDLFLVGKRRVTTKRNETGFRIENTTVATEGRSLNNRSSFNLNLRLPNVEKYWQLKFTSYDEQQEERGVRRSYLRQVPREKNYGATVGLFKKLGKIRTSFEPRIELEDPLKIAHSLEFESVAEYKTYRFNPKLEFFANPSRGVGVFQALNLNFYLSKANTLTIINQGEYEERTHLFSGTHGFSLGHTVSKSQAISYTALMFSNNKPRYKANSYNVSIAWSETIYKRILDYQIIPNVEFGKARSFKGIFSTTFNVNLHF